MALLLGGGPLPGSENRCLFNTWKWIVKGDTYADTAEDFIGKGCRDGEPQGRGPESWVFTVMGLAFQIVSGQSSYLCPHWSNSRLSGGMCISQSRLFPGWGFLGGWQDIVWAGISSLLLPDPSPRRWILLSGGSLSVLCSLSGIFVR